MNLAKDQSGDSPLNQYGQGSFPTGGEGEGIHPPTRIIGSYPTDGKSDQAADIIFQKPREQWTEH